MPSKNRSLTPSAFMFHTKCESVLKKSLHIAIDISASSFFMQYICKFHKKAVLLHRNSKECTLGLIR